jgi:hypothetical protein
MNDKHVACFLKLGFPRHSRYGIRGKLSVLIKFNNGNKSLAN